MVSSGSSTACCPASRGTVRHVGGSGQVDMSVQQRWRARGAVGHAALDLGEAVESVPEHLPLLLLEAAVGLSVVEDVDLVVVARAPEQRSEEHTSELQSRENLVCRLLLEKKKNNQQKKLKSTL